MESLASVPRCACVYACPPRSRRAATGRWRTGLSAVCLLCAALGGSYLKMMNPLAAYNALDEVGTYPLEHTGGS